MTTLEHISQAINWVLFDDEKATNDAKLFVVERLNQIFGTKLTINLTAKDLSLDDSNVTVSQLGQLKSLIKDLQAQHVLSPDKPCTGCGKYFGPGEDAYKVCDGCICEDCWNKRFETYRDWDEYQIKANLGEKDPNSKSTPMSRLLAMFSDEKIAELVGEVEKSSHPVAYFSAAAE